MNLLGEVVHNFIDGILIASSFLVSIPVGISTMIAVMLHEIPQEISDMGLLLYSGYSRRQALFFNACAAATAILGAAVVLITASSLPTLTSILLPLGAGSFLYIAGSDLIPELHKETDVRQSLTQFVTILAGICLMAALTLLE